jgi:large subunit ribosomal protein L13
MIVIDATNLIVGRMGAKVAKMLLLGETIELVNCEKAVMTGNKHFILTKYMQRRKRGIPLKGPYFPKMPDRIVRRVIRGMLPWQQTRGREAYKRLMCHVGIPEQFKDKKPITLKEANASKLTNFNYITIGEISKSLGAKL